MNAHQESMPLKTRKHTNNGKRLRTRRGASTVELALVLPIFFTLLFTAYEFGRANLMRHGAESAAYDHEPVRAPERTGEVRHSVVDASLVRTVLGWEAWTSLREGVATTLEWARRA